MKRKKSPCLDISIAKKHLRFLIFFLLLLFGWLIFLRPSYKSVVLFRRNHLNRVDIEQSTTEVQEAQSQVGNSFSEIETQDKSGQENWKLSVIFLYLTNDGSKEPPMMTYFRKAGYEVLGFAWNNSGDQVDFFVPGLSWTNARNFLYYQAMKLQKKIDYFIFLDGDIVIFPRELEKCERPWNQSLCWQSALDEFLKHLLVYRPAVAVATMFSEQHKTRIGHVNRSKEPPEQFFAYWKKNNMGKNGKISVPVFFFDAAFNAIDREAAQFLLPYDDKFDEISWWVSQRIFDLKSNRFFSGLLMNVGTVIMWNSDHWEYPRVSSAKTDKELSMYVEESFSLPWRKCPFKHREKNILLKRPVEKSFTQIVAEKWSRPETWCK